MSYAEQPYTKASHQTGRRQANSSMFTPIVWNTDGCQQSENNYQCCPGVAFKVQKCRYLTLHSYLLFIRNDQRQWDCNNKTYGWRLACAIGSDKIASCQVNHRQVKTMMRNYKAY